MNDEKLTSGTGAHDAAPATNFGDRAATGQARRSSMRDLVTLGVIVLVLAGMLTYTVHYHRTHSGPQSAALPGGSLVGKPAPDFQLTTLDGKNASLADFRGKAVLLNFWATYCGPCRIEMPWFVDLQKKYAAQGFQIVGIDDEDVSDKTLKDFIDQIGTNYPILHGKDAVADAYGVEGLPTTFFIGRNGKVIDQTLGLASKKELEQRIQRTISSAPQTSSANTASDSQRSAMMAVLDQKKRAGHKALAWLQAK